MDRWIGHSYSIPILRYKISAIFVAGTGGMVIGAWISSYCGSAVEIPLMLGNTVLLMVNSKCSWPSWKETVCMPKCFLSHYNSG